MKGPVCLGRGGAQCSEKTEGWGSGGGSRQDLKLQPRASPRQAAPGLLISGLFFPYLTKSPSQGQALGSLSCWSSLGQRSHLQACSPGLASQVPAPGSLISLLALINHPSPSTKAQGPPNNKAGPQKAFSEL